MKSFNNRELMSAVWGLTTAVTNLNSRLDEISKKLDKYLARNSESTSERNIEPEHVPYPLFERKLIYPDFERWKHNAIRTESGLIFAPEDFSIIYGKVLHRDYFTYDEAMELEKRILRPNGWRLPTDEEWNTTIREFEDKDQLMDSLRLSYTGFVHCDKMDEYRKTIEESLVSNRGSSGYGYYWSSTAYSSNSAYSLTFSSSRVYPGTDDYYKYNGRAVRCVEAI